LAAPGICFFVVVVVAVVAVVAVVLCESHLVSVSLSLVPIFVVLQLHVL